MGRTTPNYQGKWESILNSHKRWKHRNLSEIGEKSNNWNEVQARMIKWNNNENTLQLRNVCRRPNTISKEAEIYIKIQSRKDLIRTTYNEQDTAHSTNIHIVSTFSTAGNVNVKVDMKRLRTIYLLKCEIYEEKREALRRRRIRRFGTPINWLIIKNDSRNKITNSTKRSILFKLFKFQQEKYIIAKICAVL